MSKYKLPLSFNNKTTTFHPEVFEQAKNLQWLQSEDGTIWAGILNIETKEQVGFTKEEFEELVLKEGFNLDLKKWKSLSWSTVEDDEANDEPCICGTCDSEDDEEDSFYSSDTTGKYFN